jgi:hypothetical protein
MPVIYPAPGEDAQMARLLLGMVDDPHTIGVTNEGGIGFVVSDEVEQLWLDSLCPPVEPQPVAVPDPEPELVPAPQPQHRKNRKKE